MSCLLNECLNYVFILYPDQIRIDANSACMRVILLFTLFFSSIITFGQNAIIDSLQSILSTTPADSNKVNILISLAYEFGEIDAQKTIEYAVEAQGISKKIGFKKGEAQSTRNIGLGYYKTGRYDTAIMLCEQAVEMAKNAGLSRIMADALNTIGNVYYRKGEIYKAIDTYEQILPIYEKLGKKIDRAGTISNIGSIYSSQGNYRQALQNFQEALQLFERLDHVSGKANVQHNLADLYEKQGEYDKALIYYLQTASNDSISGNKAGRAYTLSNVANVYTQLGDTVKAIQNYYHAMSLFQESGSNCSMNMPQTNLGELYLHIGQIDSAYFYIITAYETSKRCESTLSIVQSLIDLSKYYQKVGDLSSANKNLQEAYDLANELQLQPIIAKTANELYLLNRKTNNYKEALKYLEIKEEINEDLFNEDNTRALTRLEAEYEFEKERQSLQHLQELEILEYNEELAQKNLIQMIIVVGLIIMSLSAIIISRLYLDKKKANKKLALTNNEILEQNAEIQAQNEEITQQRDQLEERSKVVEEQKIELLKKNEELLALNDEKNALIGIVAHDLKSPLNQIRGMVGVALLSKSEGTDELSEYLKIIEDSSNRSVEMIDRILDVNAIENRQFELNIETVDISIVLDEACQNLSISAQEKDLAVHRLYVGKNSKVDVDQNLLLEVFENLLSNAIKFSEKGKNIFIVLEESNDTVKVKIKDEGPGISENDQKFLFNKYQRLSAKPTAGEKSTGLGLAIVKRFVEEMGALVWCESKLGEGATFVVELSKNVLVNTQL